MAIQGLAVRLAPPDGVEVVVQFALNSTAGFAKPSLSKEKPCAQTLAERHQS